MPAASFCKEKLPPPPKDGKVVLARPGLSFGRCFFDTKDGTVPSCPYIKVNRIDSLWLPPQKPNEGTKIVYLWRFVLTATQNVLHIDNAILNVTFSAPSVISNTSIYKVCIKGSDLSISNEI